MNEWDDRAGYYRESRTHAEGADLDQVVAWCEPAPRVAALDVGPRGGPGGRGPGELGCRVTTCDAAAGMEPDVVCPAEALPFEDASYDVCACRIAAHHFDDPVAAMGEMARVSRRLVVVEDTLFVDERVQEAERLRDITHVRHYRREEWLRLFADAGLDVVAEATFEKRHDMADWLSATSCTGAAAVRVRGLLAHMSDSEGDGWVDVKIVLKAEKRA